MLEIVGSYHCLQFQEKRMIQTQENGKKPYFGPDLGPFGRISGHQIFYFYFFFQKSGLVNH